MIFNSRKIFKAYYGFRVLYVSPFPSASHWPLVSGRDKVGIRAIVLLLILNCRFVFSYTTAVLGCQMSVLSSLLPVFCVVSVCYCVWFYLVCLLWMRRRAQYAPTAEAVDNVEQSFQGEALAPAPRRRGRGSSGRGVLSHVVYVLSWFLWLELLAWLYITLIAGDV